MYFFINMYPLKITTLLPRGQGLYPVKRNNSPFLDTESGAPIITLYAQDSMAVESRRGSFINMPPPPTCHFPFLFL